MRKWRVFYLPFYIFGPLSLIMNIAPTFSQYNTSIPRYTSYPTVPNWKEWTEKEPWTEQLKSKALGLREEDGISIYIHLPFCEQLCTYCGCNKKITTNHRVEKRYIDRLLAEWALYMQAFGYQKVIVRELHLGGGTPTFFAPEELQRLIKGLFIHAHAHPNIEMSFEGHPNNTTFEHLQVLRQLGFNRVSYGVQDLDLDVQQVINRIQPLENLIEVTEMSRLLGYASVNFDLVYGLPLQNEQKLAKTLREVIALRPERVAFYGYAHVPWKSRAQRLYDESDLPTPEQRMTLYQMGREAFLSAGYEDIGMDHFALPQDALLKALHSKSLHRNFMGYTTHPTPILIGLGVSAISDLGGAFAQNSKELAQWERMIDAGEFAVDKGLILTEEDRIRQQLILRLSCLGMVTLPLNWKFNHQQEALMLQMLADKLITFDDNCIALTSIGKLFTRHACSLFDAYLSLQNTNSKQFSQAV